MRALGESGRLVMAFEIVLWAAPAVLAGRAGLGSPRGERTVWWTVALACAVIVMDKAFDLQIHVYHLGQDWVRALGPALDARRRPAIFAPGAAGCALPGRLRRAVLAGPGRPLDRRSKTTVAAGARPGDGLPRRPSSAGPARRVDTCGRPCCRVGVLAARRGRGDPSAKPASSSAPHRTRSSTRICRAVIGPKAGPIQPALLAGEGPAGDLCNDLVPQF